MTTKEIFGRNLRNKLDAKRKTQQDLAKHLIVKDAIEYYKLHQSANATTRYINDNYGLTFTHPNLVKLFRNPILKGEYRTNPSFCEPLLTADEWSDLQRLLGNNIKKSSPRTFIFSGLVKCPVCGRRMGGCTSNNHKYYRCTRHIDGVCSFSKSISEKQIEKWLLDNIEEDYKVQVTMKPKAKKDGKEIIERVGGMTTPQDAIKREIDLWKSWSFIEVFFKDLDKVLCLPIY